MIEKLMQLVDKKLLRFIIVGCINTIVGTAIMFGLYNLASCSYWISSAANYILTSILSFFLNKYFTFRNKERSWKQVMRFAVNIAVCYILHISLPAPITSTLSSVGNMIGPMGMLLAGMAIAEVPLKKVFCTPRNYLPVFLRLLGSRSHAGPVGQSGRTGRG